MSAEFRFVYQSAVYDETVAFLRDKLELPVLNSWDRPGDHRGTLFAAASGIVEVLENAQAQRAAPGSPFMVIEVEDVDAVHERIAGRGVAVHHELRDKPWGHRGFSVLDPNGVEIAFFTWIRR
jgi:catechol 2,3-dioxygenase-like lactoylglutathione lyase family enzyme